MEKIYSCCCGLDVHKFKIVACLLKKGQGPKEGTLREFQAYTPDLIEMAKWLKDNHCDMVAMESTGSYWKPAFNILEETRIDAMVVNASRIKHVPGRKTDINDAMWIADLCMHGLLTPSFIPDRPGSYRRPRRAHRHRRQRDRHHHDRGAEGNCREDHADSRHRH